MSEFNSRKLLWVGDRDCAVAISRFFCSSTSVVAASTEEDAMRAIEQSGPFSVVILSKTLTTEGAKRLEALARRRDPNLEWFVLHAVPESDTAESVTEKSGAVIDEIESFPIELGPLDTLELSDSMQPRILVVDDDAQFSSLTERILAAQGYPVTAVNGGVAALRFLREKGAEIVISDCLMPQLNGLDLCRAVREQESIGFVYMILMTAESSPHRLLEAFEAGADDFLTKPFDRAELLVRVEAGRRIVQLESDLARRNLEIHKHNAEMAILNAKLERQATTDELTGLFNRRHTLEKLRELWAISQRYSVPLSCIMFDIDHFKRFNDSHGHAVGDVVLKSTSRVISNVIRTTDIVGRVGGEEFLVLCPNTDGAGAGVLAERLRAAVAEQVITNPVGPLVVHISLGIAERTEKMSSSDAFVNEADAALYRAKASGRNCVCGPALEAVRVAS